MNWEAGLLSWSVSSTVVWLWQNTILFLNHHSSLSNNKMLIPHSHFYKMFWYLKQKSIAQAGFCKSSLYKSDSIQYVLYWKKSNLLKLIVSVEIYQLDKSFLKSDGIADKWAWKRFHSLFFTARTAPFHLSNGLQESDLTISWLRQSGWCLK